MWFLTRLSTLCVLVFGLAACGGGGESNGGIVDSDQDQIEFDDGLPNDLDELEAAGSAGLSVAQPLNGLTPSRIVTGFGEFDASQAEIALPSDKSIYFAEDDDGTIVWIAIIEASSEEVVLDAKSTANALALFAPELAGIAQQYPYEFSDSLRNNTYIDALENVVSTISWDDMSDPVFVDALSNAVKEIMTRLAVIVPELSGGQASIQQIQIDGAGSELNYDTPIPKSGVTLEILDSDFNSSDPTITIGLENDYRRYLWVAIGDRFSSTSDELYSFLFGPADWLGLNNNQTERLVKIKDIPLPSIGNENYQNYLEVTILGPGFLGEAYSGKLDNNYRAAIVLNTMVLYVLPILEVTLGGDCLNPFFQSVFLSAEFIENVINADWGNLDQMANGGQDIRNITARVLAWSGFKAVLKQASSCVASGALEKALKLAAGGAALPAIEYGILITPPTWAWLNSRSVETFKIENLVAATVSSQGGEGILLNAGVGKEGYTSQNEISLDQRALYNGTCQSQQSFNQTTFCGGYTFNSEPPYEVTLNIDCTLFYPEAYSDVECKSGLYESTSGVSSNNRQEASFGDLTFVQEYQEAGEHDDKITIYDSQGAEHQINLSMQIKRAQPQLEVLYRGQIIPMRDADGKILKSTSRTRLNCCTNRSSPHTEVLTLFNYGDGSAIITDISIDSDLSGLEINSLATFPLIIPPSGLAQLSLGIDPEEISTNATLGVLDFAVNIEGFLGGVPAARNQEPGFDVSFEEYSSIHMDLQITSEFSNRYIKMDELGQDLPYSSKEWACVRDLHTGLTWANKQEGADAGLHAKGAEYYWGGIGVKPFPDDYIGPDDFDPGSAWDALVLGTNSQQLCGFSDWTVARIEEVYKLWEAIPDQRVPPPLNWPSDLWTSSFGYVPNFGGVYKPHALTFVYDSFLTFGRGYLSFTVNDSRLPSFDSDGKRGIPLVRGI